MSENILDLISVAPLAGISDSPFRAVCRKFGAKELYTEMVSVEGVWRKHKNTLKLVGVMEEDGPVVLQLFGSNPESFFKATQILDDIENVKEININSGCPVKKVLKSGSGASLMKDPVLLGKIVANVKKATQKPVSVKLRLGFDFSSINYIECSKICEQEGAETIILHPRTAKMMFSGKADWTHIKNLKAELGIKVVGNGDVLNLSDADRMIHDTNCDSVMVGRAIFGNPWFFKDEEKKISKAFIEVLLWHLGLSTKFYGEARAYKLMKKHLIYYVKGTDIAPALKKHFYDLITRSQNINDEITAIKGLYE